MKKKTFITLTLTLFLPLGLLLYGVWNYQSIADYVRLIDYQPPARIEQIRNDISLTDYGEKLFYVHSPKIIDRSSFTSSCPVYEQTIVLGCYFTHTSIYIFDVEDTHPELQGVEEVTAAHEILHAAYDRLSDSEKNRLHTLLLEVYQSLDPESRIRRNIDEYRNQGESVVLNELHSIIGTEVADLPQELEEYYAAYFVDRQVVVALSKEYESVFESLQNEISTFDARLETLSGEITSLEAQIQTYQNDLQVRSSELDRLRTDPSLYNAKVEDYNVIVRLYNNVVEDYKSKIDSYNELVKQRNIISTEQTELYDAIDARAEEVEEE